MFNFNRYKRNSKLNVRGVTLVALVVTIVVLLILSGVSITMLTGQNGIINNATNSKSQTEYQSINEAISLKLAEKNFDDYSSVDDEEFLRINGILDDSGVLNISKLLSISSKGNGSWENGDLYVISDNMLKYYDTNKKFINIGTLDALNENVFEFVEDTGIITGIKDKANVENMVIPKIINNHTVKAILPWIFQGRTDIKTVTIYADIDEIPNGLFQHCDNLEKVVLNPTVQRIGIDTFQYCGNLKEINIQDTIINNIDNLAFGTCEALQNLEFPNTLLRIGENAFENCNSLEEITIPSSTKIETLAFANCKSLVYINMLGNIEKSIGNSAFGNTSSLKNIRFESSSILNSATWDWGVDPNKSVYNKDLKDKYKKTTKLDEEGQLSILNGKLVNSENKNVELRGISLNGLQWSTKYVSYQNFKNLRKNWNVNLIRIPIIPQKQASWISYEDTKDWIDKAVKYATANGMYIILDFHGIGNPSDYIDEGQTLFNDLSIKYKNYNNIFYEIFNEPSTDNNNQAISWENMKKYAETVISKIRANDTNNIIVCGIPTYSSDLTNVQNNILSDKKTMYAFHFYAGTHKLSNYKASIESSIAKKVPIFVSECSIVASYGKSDISEQESKNWFEFLNKNNISWVYWNLSNAKEDYAAILNSDVDKTSNWSYNELSDAGKWIYTFLKSQK